MNLESIMQQYEINKQGGNLNEMMATYHVHFKGDTSHDGCKIEPATYPFNIALVIKDILDHGLEGYLTPAYSIGEGVFDLTDHAELVIARHNESNTQQLEVPHIEDIFNYLPEQITAELREKYKL
ncbi:MAG: hypothetical protein KAI18_02035 [Candidatus Aenigmarchaeota archaeon]|nr:hypothetical protein [Candidatus Aenigmarchaeota archaeon]